MIEIMAALAILVAIGVSVLTVINNCIEKTIDNELKMQAFAVARENMEMVLGSTTVSEMVEFGSLEENPDIQWEIAVEPFSEPITSKMWIRAVSSASYTAASGERENIEFTHWITDLTEKQIKQIEDQRQEELDNMDDLGENPYGDDAAGLLRWARSLAKSGDAAGAAKVAQELQKEFPESPEAQTPVLKRPRSSHFLGKP